MPESEAEYLARESAAAQAAAFEALEQLKNSLASAADIRIWARKHPWIAVGAAAATGFVAAAGLKATLNAVAAPPTATEGSAAQGVGNAGRSTWAPLVGNVIQLGMQSLMAAMTQPQSSSSGATNPDAAGDFTSAAGDFRPEPAPAGEPGFSNPLPSATGHGVVS